jgi:hypothetical protein
MDIAGDLGTIRLFARFALSRTDQAMEVFMRKTLLTLAAATAVFAAGALVSDRADATTLGSGIRTAADAISPVDLAQYGGYGGYGGGYYRPRYYRPHYRPYYRPYY